MGFTNGDGPAAVAAKVKRDLMTQVTGSWTVWPIAHAINFRFIPTSQRLLYINTIQVGTVQYSTVQYSRYKFYNVP